VASVSLHEFGQNMKAASFHYPNGEAQMLSKLCENKDLAQLIVTKVREVITTLERNGSYTEVLQKHKQAIAYIKSNTNFDVLSLNCTEYFNRLNNAWQLDEQAEEQKRYYEENAIRLLQQMLQPVIGSRNFINENFLK